MKVVHFLVSLEFLQQTILLGRTNLVVIQCSCFVIKTRMDGTQPGQHPRVVRQQAAQPFQCVHSLRMSGAKALPVCLQPAHERSKSLFSVYSLHMTRPANFTARLEPAHMTRAKPFSVCLQPAHDQNRILFSVSSFHMTRVKSFSVCLQPVHERSKSISSVPSQNEHLPLQCVRSLRMSEATAGSLFSRVAIVASCACQCTPGLVLCPPTLKGSPHSRNRGFTRCKERKFKFKEDQTHSNSAVQ